MKKIIITEAYEYYWKFATERQSIFYNRYENKAKITNNPILKKYKFTNAYRASDRVSQYLIKEVIYKNNKKSNFYRFRVDKNYIMLYTNKVVESR